MSTTIPEDAIEKRADDLHRVAYLLRDPSAEREAEARRIIAASPDLPALAFALATMAAIVSAERDYAVDALERLAAKAAAL